ncbi:hypothetical protein JCM6882_001522 [Rhodosporidiobolus microsporus]
MADHAHGKGKEELKGAEVLELTTFAEKKAWIDSKIAFLSALPPVVIDAPHPPERSSVGKEQLEEWWTEHDRIEEEVGEYDMGDLEKMRRLARDKSKQALSPKDTDLIEITLTTLFAVDKLLHLLRNRRKALSLLGYRLQWEDALATGWQSHHHLIDDLLPAFLTSARWTIPAAISSPSRHPSDDPSATLSASTSSLSSSTSSRRISSLNSSTSGPSASSVTRTMRHQMLALSQQHLSAHLLTLTSQHLPLSGTLLDKLIDSSPAPLPDSFLDEQDRVELEVGRAKGLEGFADGMARQWRAADEAFWRACEVEREGEKIARDAEEAVALLPSSSSSSTPSPSAVDPETFPSRLSSLSARLTILRSSLSSLPSPSHPLAPSQPTLDTPKLAATLRKNVDRAAAAVEQAQAAVGRWGRAKEACEEAQGVRGELERVLGAVRVAREGMERMKEEGDGPPADPEGQEGVRCLDAPPPSEAAWQRAWDAALAPALPLLTSSTLLLRRAASALGALSSLGSSPSVASPLRREVRELAHAVRGEVDALRGEKEREEGRRERVGAARGAKEAVEKARGVVKERVEVVARRVCEECWVEGGRSPRADEAGVLLDATQEVENARAAVQQALAEPFAAVERTLSSAPTCASLLAHLHSLRRTVESDDLAALSSLASLLASVRDQAAAVRRFEADAEGLEERLVRVGGEASEALSREGKEWKEGELEQLRAKLEEETSELRGEVDQFVGEQARTVPFLDPSAASPSCALFSPATPAATVPPAHLDFSLSTLDASVRSFVNSTSAQLEGQLDDVNERLALLEHQEGALKWDEEASGVERSVEAVEERVKEAERRLAERTNDAEATLAPLFAHLAALDFSLTSSSIAGLSVSFDRLLSSASSSSPPFHAHPARRERLDALSSRLETARTAASAAEKTLIEARQARDERVTQWEKKRDALAEQLRENAKETEAITAEAAEVEKELSTANERVAAERETLLEAAQLEAEADVPFPAADKASAILSSLRSRCQARREALDPLSSALNTLKSSLPSLHTPSADLTPASAAHTTALSACSAADAAVSRLDQALAASLANSEAWRSRRDKEIDRRRRVAAEEEEARAAAAAAAAAAFAAWQAKVANLSRSLDAERRTAEEITDRANEELRAVEGRLEEGKRAREEALASPSLAEDAPLPHASAVGRAAMLLAHLREQASEVQRRGAEVEDEAQALMEDEVASSIGARALVDEVKEKLSPHPSSMKVAEAALDLLAERIEGVEREERGWGPSRDAELERRRVEEEGQRVTEMVETQEDKDAAPAQSLRRSQALPALAIVEAEDEDDPFASSSPSDPFSLTSPSLQEPAQVQQLRQQLASITAQEWLDSLAVLQLPSSADAAEVRRQVADCRAQLEDLETSSPELLVWTDVDGLKHELEEKDEASKRVVALADLGAKVDVADQALSDLLNSIDAAAPDAALPPDVDDDSPPALPLPEALARASDGIAAVRLTAVPLIDDERVERTIHRIEETWSEMLSMVEADRPLSSASSISTPSQPSLRPRPPSSASSRTSSRASTRTPSARGPSRPSSETSSLRSSTRPTSRPPSSASSTASKASSRPSTVQSASVSTRPSSAALLAPRTPRKNRDEEDMFATPTPRRRVKSGLPVPSTVHRAVSPLPRAPPTVVRPFSFNTPTKRDLAQSTSSIPRRRVPSSASRRDSTASVSSSVNLFSPPMQRISSTSTTSSSRRDSLASSVSSVSGSLRRSSYSSRKSVGALAKSPRPGTIRSTPPRRTQAYRPKDNKLDRAVGDIVNSLSIHVPIAVADGKWTDDSGVYLIGGRLVFCRILRSKQVMCRTGGGWENLLSFVVSHFGTAAGLTISPSTSLKKGLSSAEPEWINSQTVREQLAASQSSASLRDYLSSSVSSSLSGAGNSDLSLSTSSFSLRRSFSGGGTPLRRSLASATPSFSALSPSSTATPKSRPPLPIWRP